VLRTDRYLVKVSIHIQVPDEKGYWNDVASFIPRHYWSTDIIDLSKFLHNVEGSIKIRLYFTANHKLDFVGLDTSPQATMNMQLGQLISAIHSVSGDVTASLLYSDSTYAELLPEECIELNFTLPQQTVEVRTYIFIVEGHYYTITP